MIRLATLLLVCALSLLAETSAGLTWTPPAGWKSAGKTDFRPATYPVAPAAGDKDSAECAVYFFGRGQGGPVQANLDRWKSQFTTGGKPSEAKVASRDIHGLHVTTIDVSGDYSGMGGPLAAQQSVGRNYRLLGAIVEGPEGNIFVKFSGPAKTMAANEPKFQELISSFRKAGN